MKQAIILALALAVPSIRADVTIRYQSEFQPSAALAPMMGQLAKSMQAASATSIRVKDNKAYTAQGNWIQLFDFVKKEVTLVDPETKTFATFPIEQLSDKLAGALPQPKSTQSPDVQQALASIKSQVDSKATGKTAEIMGVQAEEREITITMDLPLMAAQAGPGLKLVMHIWNARKEEALRVPAIRELTGYQAWQRYVMNPTGMLDKMFAKLPGMSNTFTPMFEEMCKNPSVILRMRMEMYVPFLAAFAKRSAGQGQASAADPDAPAMSVTQEVAELSSAPVDASLFEVPKDYTVVSADEIIGKMLKARTAAAAPSPAPSPK